MRGCPVLPSEAPVFRSLALALALLLPGAVLATEPPPPSPEALAQASDWFVGRWVHEGRVEPPDLGPGLARVAMEVRADRSIEMSGAFTPDGAAAPVTDFRMTGTWRVEDADSLRLLGLRMSW